MADLRFLSGGGTATGSKYLLRSGLRLGLRQGRDAYSDGFAIAGCLRV